ncbi:protein MIZU-KUSSEI 1-like [Neltuma alba]|uniref:protein MIZU-KUSSEI 1-like n=1 Tax=Neltuma alba TaxID=207710 RepID=UPI0010A49A52|nr:protein MIZU-KUSSEI 1-like [Prosopis alba]
MSVITAKSSHDSSFSFSRRFLHWKKYAGEDDDDDENLNTTTTTSSSSHSTEKHDQIPKKSRPIFKFKSVLPLTFFSKTRSLCHPGPGTTRTLIGTLFGRRRGHVHLAFQWNPKSSPCFLIELATPTSVLIREMASGLVRIALECEKKAAATVELLEEPRWRAYCNGRKCGNANNKRECGEEEWKVLKVVEPMTMGAGVLPAAAGSVKGNEAGGSEGELMYMRAKFERVVGSKDSEAFYMMNPDHHQANNNGGSPELSIYLLRV